MVMPYYSKNKNYKKIYRIFIKIDYIIFFFIYVSIRQSSCKFTERENPEENKQL
jgi:hypothetical protein